MDSDRLPELSRTELLAADVDVRLHSVMLPALSEEDMSGSLLACYLRLAYGAGYHDALTEKARGCLFRDHGFQVPNRSALQ